MDVPKGQLQSKDMEVTLQNIKQSLGALALSIPVPLCVALEIYSEKEPRANEFTSTFTAKAVVNTIQKKVFYLIGTHLKCAKLRADRFAVLKKYELWNVSTYSKLHRLFE